MGGGHEEFFVKKMVQHLKELEFRRIAQKVEDNKAPLFQFLKDNHWTQEDMNRDWFANNSGQHCYGLETADNFPTAETHCAILYIRNDSLMLGTSNKSGRGINYEKARIEVDSGSFYKSD